MKRPRANYANIVSTIALIASLGTGTAYAATLANNSVASRHIVNGSVQWIDLAYNSVTGKEIVNGTVGLTDLKANARPRALRSTQASAQYFFSGSEGDEMRYVLCPPGYVATDGYASGHNPHGGLQYSEDDFDLSGRAFTVQVHASGNLSTNLLLEVDCVG